jgi:hypothetical protein
MVGNKIGRSIRMPTKKNKEMYPIYPNKVHKGYFPNLFLAILHTSLVLMFIYFKHSSLILPTQWTEKDIIFPFILLNIHNTETLQREVVYDEPFFRDINELDFSFA